MRHDDFTRKRPPRERGCRSPEEPRDVVPLLVEGPAVRAPGGREDEASQGLRVGRAGHERMIVVATSAGKNAAARISGS
jgi:hypothetical protein